MSVRYLWQMQIMDTTCRCKARSVHSPLKHSAVFGACADKLSIIELLWTLWILTLGLDNKALAIQPFLVLWWQIEHYQAFVLGIQPFLAGDKLWWKKWMFTQSKWAQKVFCTFYKQFGWVGQLLCHSTVFSGAVKWSVISNLPVKPWLKAPLYLNENVCRL